MPGFMERFTGGNNNQNTEQNQNNNQNNQNNQNQNQNSSDNNNDNNNNNDNDNNNNNQNNNVDNNKSIWDNNDSKTENNNNQQNNQNNQNAETRSPNEIFNEHVAGLNLTEGIDLTQLQEDAQAGNSDSLNKAFETVASNVYKASLQQMNTLVDNKINSAIEKAVSESTSVMNESTAVKEMQTALPFTSDKNIAPVAEAALKQIMSNGASVQEAVKQVADFFESTAQAVGGNNNDQSNPTGGNFNPNSNVNNNSNNNNNSNQEDTWMDFLTQ